MEHASDRRSNEAVVSDGHNGRRTRLEIRQSLIWAAHQGDDTTPIDFSSRRMIDSLSSPEFVRGHCPRCGPNCLADVVRHHHKHEDHNGEVWTNTDCRILKCRGCGKEVYFQIDTISSDDWDIASDPITGEEELVYIHRIDHWPVPSRRDYPKRAAILFSLDAELGSIFGEGSYCLG